MPQRNAFKTNLKEKTTSHSCFQHCYVGVIFVGAICVAIRSSFLFMFVAKRKVKFATKVLAQPFSEMSADSFGEPMFYPRIVSFHGMGETESIHGAESIPRLYYSGETIKSSLEVDRQYIMYRRKNQAQAIDNINETHDNCQSTQSWQETSFPTCNMAHEVDMTRLDDEQVVYLTSGLYSDIFKIKHGNNQGHYVFKQSRMLDAFEESESFEASRFDALVMERLTKSPYVMPTYTFCGYAAIVPFSADGTLEELISKRDLEPDKKLHVAAQLAMSLADAHGIDGDERPSILHRDLAAKQYIMIDGIFKLNDFNMGKLVKWNKVSGEACAIKPITNNGLFRSPEEVKMEVTTFKVDVWALGGVLFLLLTRHYAWFGNDQNEARQLIANGHLPRLPWNVTRIELERMDPAYRVLLHAIFDMCFVYEPEKRPTALEVSKFLNSEAGKQGLKVHQKIDFAA